ncbi:MAG TPA: PPE family protein [Mycobacterium sp.]|uniref:PPE family protein n=1 Tax=Mycobacterium sp. TaxID=1785 RepID=UPI002D59E73F|nr:PPE family protein [Mycobacterium sp.]HZU48021.1 PPE family protein [Mycobacterium sp.]
MDYGLLPPEINSARIYAGPGSGSLMAAATAWNALAAQLRATAASYSSVVSGLTAGWQGPSSASMAAAAAPYAAWLNTTAAQAEQTAAQVQAGAAAYETAFAATVPPPVIAANRSQLATLMATNVLGQNTPAIAATEAQYADMWAQDAAAMYGYAGQSAAATRLTPFSSPPPTTNPGGGAGQAAAVAQASGTAPANAHSALSPLMSATPQALQSLAAPAAADPPAAAADPPSLASFLSALNSSPLAQGLGDIEFVTKGIRPVNDALLSTSLGLVASARTLNDSAVTGEAEIFASIPSAGGLAGGFTSGANALGGASEVSAGVGRAGLVGALSVPPSWAAATPTVRLAASVLQGTAAAAAPTAAAEGVGNLFSQMGLASLAGGALGGAVPRVITASAARGTDPGIDNGKDGKEGKQGSGKDTPEKLKRVLAELSQQPESVQHWHTDKAHLESLLEQLTSKPGVHAVHVSGGEKPKPAQPKAQWG